MAEVQWIKLYLDMFDTNPKIKKIRRLPSGNDIVLIWIMLLVKAGRCNAGGHIFITENMPYTVEDLADEFKFKVGTIKLAMNAFVEFDMIVVDDEGFIFVTGWEEYQNADKLAEIRAKDRERKRKKRAQAKALLGESTDVHGNSTDCPHIEEEGEEDKEKEYHSFIRSNAREEKSENEFSTDLSTMRKRLGGTLGAGVVFLSDEQMNHLLDILSLDEFDYYVGVVRDQELQGKHYKKKTHYQAILDMAKKDRKII